MNNHESQLDILRRLVAFQTVVDKPEEADRALEYIDTYLAERGMHVQRSSFGEHGALVATTHPTKTPAVMLTAHLDVVPAAPEAFTLRNDQGKVFGRGVYDMKFAIACYMQLVDELRGKLADYDFGIMITSDEELSGITHSVKMLVSEGYIPKVAILPDGGDNWDIEKFAKGAWYFDVVAKGKSAHGSRPWEGASAAEPLLDTLQDIRNLFKAYQKPDTPTLNIGTISGGTARNQVAEYMQASIDIRITNRIELAELQKQVSDICRKHGTELEGSDIIPPMITDLKNPYVRHFSTSVQNLTGQPCNGIISYGASDGQYFDAVNVPCILCRPPGGGHHSNKEWIDEHEFYAYKDVLADFMLKVAYQPRLDKVLVTV